MFLIKYIFILFKEVKILDDFMQQNQVFHSFLFQMGQNKVLCLLSCLKVEDSNNKFISIPILGSEHFKW